MATDQDTCCGCSIENDYGTSIVTGDGSVENPYSVETVDPTYQRLAAKVRRTTNQSIAAGAFTAISFDLEVFDQGNFWTIGSPTVFSISERGLYLLGANALWAANNTGTRELGFRLNGSQIIQVNDSPVEPLTGGTLTPWQTVEYQYRFETGDTIELVARQESGGNLNLLTEVDDSIVFWILYIGRTI